MSQERYSEEAAREILKRAVSLESTERDFSRDQLREMAMELGITEDSLVKAERQWLSERESIEEQKQFERDRQEFDAHRRREFMGHFMVYAVVNIFLLFMNIATGIDDIWFIYPLLGWGIGVAIHASVTLFQKGGEEYEKQFIEWRAKRQIQRDTYRRLSS